MDCHHCITESAEHKKGQHLRMEDRGAIKVLKKQGLGPRAIARQIGCAPSTVTNELWRGTPARKSNKGKAPGYSPKLGEAVYRANRASCHRHPKAGVCSNFTSWVVRQIREHKWSLDACCGYAKRHDLFEPSEMVCSHTLYNMVWKGHLSIQPMELPEALNRKARSIAWERTKSATAQAFPAARRLHLFVLKRGTGKAIPWSASERVRRLLSFPCWRRRRKPTLRSVSLAKPVRR